MRDTGKDLGKQLLGQNYSKNIPLQKFIFLNVKDDFCTKITHFFYLYKKYNKGHHQKNFFDKHKCSILLFTLRNVFYTVYHYFRTDLILKPIIPITSSSLWLFPCPAMTSFISPSG